MIKKLLISTLFAWWGLGLYAQTITTAEYFFDTDPGIGSATSFSVTSGNSISENVSVNVDALSLGFHILGVRVKQGDDQWSQTKTSSFYKFAPVTASSELVAAEYFFDTDPGLGNATALSITPGASLSGTFTVDASALGSGFHTLTVRVQDDLGQWSVNHTGRFYKINLPTTSDQIVAAEYFFDEDPGLGQGTALSIAAGTTVNQSFTAPVEGLEDGFHRVVVRFQNDLGQWSVNQAGRFFVFTPQERDEIVSLEYFIDEDPGIGQGTALPIDNISSLDSTLVINIGELSAGEHTLFVRAKDQTGFYSFAVQETFEVTTDPLVFGFSPEKGGAGTQVGISGANFSATPGENTVRFGEAEAEVVFASEDSLVVTVPEEATGIVTISVAVNGTTSTSEDKYNVNVGLPDGLIAYYPFNGNANDESGNENDGTVNGATLTIDRFGEVSSAYRFDGNDAIFANPLNIEREYSLIAWVNIGNLPNNNLGFIVIEESQSGSANFNLDIRINEAPSTLFRNIGSNTFQTVGSPLSQNQWSLIVATYDGNFLRVFANGILLAENEVGQQNLRGNATSLGIGDDASGGNPAFIGNIDDVRIYNRALSPEEIQLLVLGGDPIQPTLSADQTGLTNQSPTEVTITFDRPVSGFSLSDVKVENGTASNLVPITETAFTVSIAPDTEGQEVLVNIPTSAVFDNENNTNDASNELSFTFDLTAPTATFTTEANEFTNQSPIVFTLELSESVEDFTEEDIAVNNGSVANFIEQGPTAFFVNVAPEADGAVVVIIPENAFSDAAGNGNALVEAPVINFDNNPPEVVPFKSVSLSLNESGTAVLTAGLADSATTDAVSDNLAFSLSQTSFNCDNLGENTIFLSAEDELGNIDSAAFIVVVEDNLGPTPLLQSVEVSLDETGQAVVDATIFDNGSVDNCTIDSFELDQSVFTCNELGPNEVMVTVNDESGNSTTQSANLFVVDNIPPVAVARDITVELDKEGEATIVPDSVDNGSFDNCSWVLSLSKSTFSCFDLGVSEVMLIAEDSSGNTGSSTFTVTVQEGAANCNFAPEVINPLPDLNLQEGFVTQEVDISDVFSDPEGDSLVFSAFSSDESVISAAVSDNLIVLSEIGLGSAEITVTANDGNGNTAEATFSVIVNPANIAPEVVNALADLNLTEGFESEEVSLSSVFSDPDGDDLSLVAISGNETVVDVVVTDEVLTILEIGIGTSEVTVTADDGRGGNVSNAFIVTVDPSTNNPPALANAIQDQSLEQGFGTQNIALANTFEDADGDNLSFSASSSDDGVVTVDVSGSNLIISEVGVGVSEITVTADDGNGGIADTQFQVEVREAGTVTSIEDKDLQNRINLYPNPASTSITLSSDQALDLAKATIEVYDPAGNKINVDIARGNEVVINLKQVSAGLYLIQIKRENDRIIKRFLKE